MRHLRISEDGACWLENELLHPANRPWDAARDDMRRLLGQADANDTLIIVGAGLGWHIEAALAVLNPKRLIIYQAWPGEKSWSLCLGPELPELCWVDNAQDLAAALGERLVYSQNTGRVAVYAPPAYAAFMPELLAQVRELAARGVSRAHKDRHTRHTLAATWARHLLDNVDALFSLPDIFMTARAFSGVPALVVGAGPSLDQSLPLLADMRQKALVLGAASVLGPMAARQLQPHLVVALEGKDESRQFVNVDYRQTALLASLNGHPNHFTGWQGAKAYFHANSWLPDILHWGGVLPTGGHATSAAFSLACLWGCDPIILIGQDLAYTGGKVHASARPGGEEEQQHNLLSVPAIGGGMVNTSSVMQSYLEWYEEAASYLRVRRPGLRVINATAAGARIAGFVWQDLDECLSGLPLMDDWGQKIFATLNNTDLLSPLLAGPGVGKAAELLNRSFASPDDLARALHNTILAGWLKDEHDPNWRQGLAHLRLLLTALLKKCEDPGR